ncbi:AAI domain-containing protein [Psidium guajava]|nr:AAI domain-containing protein [Psidium guajava]
MALKRMQMGLLAVVVAALLARPCSGQSTSSCTAALMTLTPCLSYVSGNSSVPSSTCCSTLSSVVQSQPRCLCLLLNGGVSSLGYDINQTLALALPGACSVKTPSVSLCNALSPSSPPTTSPADSSDNTPVTPTASSNPAMPSGSKATPAATSASRSIKASFGSVAFALLLASFGSILLKS